MTTGIQVRSVSSKRKALFCFWVLALCFTAVVCFSFLSGPADPKVGGRRLSYLLITACGDYDLVFRNRQDAAEYRSKNRELAAEKSRAKAALEQAPKKALTDLLTHWLRPEALPEGKELVRRFGLRISDRQRIAVQAIQRDICSSPELIWPLKKAITNSHSAQAQVEAARALSRLLWKNQKLDLTEIARALQFMAEDLKRNTNSAKLLISVVEGLPSNCFLHSPIGETLFLLEFGEESEKIGAAQRLSNARMENPDQAKRAAILLDKHLSSTNHLLLQNVLAALGRLGKEAECSLPAITNILTHPNLGVREAASNTLVEIAFPL